MSVNPMSLENLAMPDFSSERFAEHRARMDAEKREYQAKYGDQWQEHLRADREKAQQIIVEKSINSRIYATGTPRYMRTDRVLPGEEEIFDARLHELYGDQYDELTTKRERCDPRVAELLLQEALRTGRWEVLPDILQSEYHERAGDGL